MKPACPSTCFKSHREVAAAGGKQADLGVAGVEGLSLGARPSPRPPPGQARWTFLGLLWQAQSSHSGLLFFHVVIGTLWCPSLPILEATVCTVEPLHLSLVFFFFCTETTIVWIRPFFFPRSGNRSGSTGTVLLVNLLPAEGFHGDSHAHPTPARGHSGHLAPGVCVWVIALRCPECVTVVAPCREGRRMVRSLLQGWGLGASRKERKHVKPSY